MLPEPRGAQSIFAERINLEVPPVEPPSVVRISATNIVVSACTRQWWEPLHLPRQPVSSWDTSYIFICPGLSFWCWGHREPIYAPAALWKPEVSPAPPSPHPAPSAILPSSRSLCLQGALPVQPAGQFLSWAEGQEMNPGPEGVLRVECTGTLPSILWLSGPQSIVFNSYIPQRSFLSWIFFSPHLFF